MPGKTVLDRAVCNYGHRIGHHSTNSYFPFILPSAQRFFIASDSRFLPSGVIPPRLFPFEAVRRLATAFVFLAAPGEYDSTSAPMARFSRSRSCFKSETIFSRSKARSLLSLVRLISLSLYVTVVAIELTRSRYLL